MARPQCCRNVGFAPSIYYFKPRGIPLSQLEEITLTMDELEAIRLADHESRYQEQAAQMMNVSRQTFGRIVDSAHRKIAQALVKGCAIRIEGGTIQFVARCGRPTHVRHRGGRRSRMRHHGGNG
jgi:predicted DNA-binding protein (UPF0251 family)